MAEAQAGQQSEAQQQNEHQEGREQEGQDGEQQQQRQAERTYTQAELDRILGKVRKNARYLGRKEAEAELVRQGATRQQAEQTVDRQQEQQKPEAPKRDDFDNYEDYLISRARYEGAQGSREDREKADKEARERTVAEQRKKTQGEFKKRADALMKEDPAWAEKIESAEGVLITEVMGDEIQESEMGPRILGHLVDNPDEAERIAGLPERAQRREIVKLEAKIAAELKVKAKPQGEEGDEEEKDEKEGEAREDESADADGKGKGKDEDRGDDGRFKAQDKGSRKAPEPIEPGTGRGANQDRGPTDKDSDTGWFAKRLAQEKAERARQRGK